MNEAVKELVSIGASVGAHCQPCLDHHIRAATGLGISPEDIHIAEVTARHADQCVLFPWAAWDLDQMDSIGRLSKTTHEEE